MQGQRRIACALLALILGAAAPAAAAEGAPEISWTFDQPPAAGDLLASLLVLGTDGAWTGEVADGRYHLENASAPASLKFFHVGVNRGGEPLDLSAATVTLDVEAAYGNGDSGAGILYRFDAATNRYLAFLMTRDGYAVWASNGNGVSRMVSGSGDAPTRGVQHLTVRSTADGLAEFLIGERVVGAVSVGSIAGVEAGFAALGTGEFSFDNFTVTAAGGAPEPAPPPAPAADATQYYIAEDNQPVGPLSLAEVEARIAAGSVGPATLVWVAGTPDWVPAATVPQLAGALGR